MKHAYFNKAVIEAYRNILPQESIPSYFIYMTADPATIDINIHPTKTEIKFEDERSIWQILMASVREALGRFNIVPSLDFDSDAIIEIPLKQSSQLIPDDPRIEINRSYNPFYEEDREKNQKSSYIDKFERESTTNWETLYSGLAGASIKSAEKEVESANQRRFFQVKNKYIICLVKSGLMVIDQKRAHERVLFEKYLETLKNKKSVTQKNMFPVPIEINPADLTILTEIDEDLRLLGFDIRQLGNNTIAVNGQPEDCGDTNPGEIIEILLEEYKSTQSDPAIGAREKIAISMSRAAAIPYGKNLGQSEMEDLFDSLFACTAHNYSPSGKPVISIITLEDLDKRFKL